MKYPIIMKDEDELRRLKPISTNCMGKHTWLIKSGNALTCKLCGTTLSILQ